MTQPPSALRRRLLVGSLALFAGCVGDGVDGSRPTDPPTTTPGDDPTDSPSTRTAGSDGARTQSTAGPATTTATARDADLDLREANVTAVAVSAVDGGAVRFDVTLIHDDDGEDGYANWWQVETLAGERLGRRDLLHPHGTREFTRSETVTVPPAVDCVAVRGHDRTHGYGGRAMLVDPRSGATRPVDQGSDPVGMADEPCP
jgi:hypothetical protein